MSVYSPLYNHIAAVKVKDVPVADLIEKYKVNFNIDAASFFDAAGNIGLYRCPKTGYQFFYPESCAGDGRFYEQLQQFEWYYMPWKWEHQIFSAHICSGMKVLEVGCAMGSFIKRIRDEKNVTAVGLELNQQSVINGRNLGVDIRNELIQDHACRNYEAYDAVCSFEVLEHISDVKAFIQGKVDALKKGGILGVAVPNNDSFIKLDFQNNILNQPPHHMGLWNRKALTALTDLFPLKVKKIYYEPVQSYHKEWHKASVYRLFNTKIKPVIAKYCRYLPSFLEFRLQKLTTGILSFYYKHGHTILVVFEKK